MTANAREEIIRLWFTMWLQKRDLGMERVFAPDAVYLESWGPEYCGLAKINGGLRNGIPGERCSNGM